MPLRYLLDEHLRGMFWKAVLNHNARHVEKIDVVRLGDPADLPLGTLDPEILAWCARESRILVSLDKRSLPLHLRDFVGAGGNSPGIFVVRDVPLPAAIEFLVFAAYASDPEEWENQFNHIP